MASVKTFLKTFAILPDHEPYMVTLNYDEMAMCMYKFLLFQCDSSIIDNAQIISFREYIERMFKLVRVLRKSTTDFVNEVLTYLHAQDKYLPDILFMIWCMPNFGKTISSRAFKNKYERLIGLYLPSLLALYDHDTVIEFCSEMWFKACNLPIHCLDLLWIHSKGFNVEIQLKGVHSQFFVHLEPREHQEMQAILKLYVPALFQLELGHAYMIDATKEQCLGDSFREFIFPLFENIELASAMLSTPMKSLYGAQHKLLQMHLLNKHQYVMNEAVRELIKTHTKK